MREMREVLDISILSKKYLTQRYSTHSLLDSNTLIAIDGYASTGKSTLAKMLSRHYKLTFIDSGSLYRGVTFYALEKGLFENDQLDKEALKEELDRLRFEI